jgi:hypothetical protein
MGFDGQVDAGSGAAAEECAEVLECATLSPALAVAPAAVPPRAPLNQSDARHAA